MNDLENGQIPFSVFPPGKGVIRDDGRGRLFEKVESLIKSATAHSRKGCSLEEVEDGGQDYSTPGPWIASDEMAIGCRQSSC